MGTANFLNKNASSVFIVAIEPEDSFMAEETAALIATDLEQRLGYDDVVDFDLSPQEDYRNFPARVLGTKVVSESINGVDAQVTIRCIMRGGYYAHANLDYEIDVSVETGEYTFEHPGLHEYRSTCKLYNISILGSIEEAYKWVDSKVIELTEELEAYYREVSQECRSIGPFSNGEVIYEPIERSDNDK